MYTYDEALRASTEYFGGDDLAGKVFIDKYCLRNNEDQLVEKTPEDMHRRIAREFARIEKKKFKTPLSEQVIFSLLDKFRYIIPQGSPMYGIGNSYKYISLSNCYLLDVPLDSYSSILQIDEQLVNISKRRGGVGIDLSNLRPSKSPTRNSARSSTGIATWMERYSNSIREVGQNARRGALMLTLSIHHPDIETFIDIKNDDTKVTGANISIRLTDEFLEAVEKDEKFELRFPVDSATPKISKVVSAKYIWNKIIHSAWLRAEPGLLFWDNVTKYTPADYYENYKSRGTNPCQSYNAPVLTKNGIRKFGEVNIGDEIWSETGWTKITNKVSTGYKKVYKYQTNSGFFLGTENHRIVESGLKIEIKNASSIDLLVGPHTASNITDLDSQDVLDGLIIGDGTVHVASNNLVILDIGADDEDYFESEIKELIIKARPGIGPYAHQVKTTIQSDELERTFNRSIPVRFLYGNRAKVLGFLRGLYSANGSVVNSRVTLKTSSREIREQVQLLLSSVGIKSYYTTNQAHNVAFANGTYLCKESYDVNISTDRDIFASLIGFIQKYKNIKLAKTLKINKGRSKNTYDITNVEYMGEEEVFDITVENATHTYWTGGVNVSNCSEINLSPLDSCRLLCLNLYSYVMNPFTDTAYFDYGLFKHHAKIAQRLMDDLVDLESECIDRILQKIENDPEPDGIKANEIAMWQKIKRNNDEGRRTGTGITALGDTLAALGIKYGSEASIIETEEIYKTLKLGCYESSVDMAEELGSFTDWDHNKEKDCPFIQLIQKEDPALYERMSQIGRRNIALLTTAPTGTVSCLTQTSSGVEPAFMLSYTRRKKINPNDENARVDFVDKMGDKWQEFVVYHPKVKDWMAVTGKTDVEESPWWGCCAEDIDWVNRVKMQAAAQKHVCHAISSTVNLPEDVDKEEVAKIYETAWKSGCKGITVYRKNCRTGVLVDKKDLEVKKSENSKKRPQEVPGEIYHIKVKGQDYFAIVGLLEGDPYEIFAGKNGHLDKKHKYGIIKKTRRGEYQLLCDDEVVCPNIANLITENEEGLTRIISTSLRHGVPLQYVVHQLEKVEGDMQSFARSIARALKKYVKDGEKVSGESCPSCQSENMVRQEGCITCLSCGNSKCG